MKDAIYCMFYGNFNDAVKYIVKGCISCDEFIKAYESKDAFLNAGVSTDDIMDNPLSDVDKRTLKKEVIKMTKAEKYISEVYNLLKERKINPKGKFDDKGRWYAFNSDLINVREPTRAYPYSEMVACRTKKYVKAVYEKYDCKSVRKLLNNV